MKAIWLKHQQKFLSELNLVTENLSVLRTSEQGDGGSYNSQSLSAYLANGTVVLIKSVSSPHCVYSQTGVHNGVMAWNSSNTLLAVMGYSREDSTSLIRFVNQCGHTVFTLYNALPHTPRTQVATHWLCWSLHLMCLCLNSAAVYPNNGPSSLKGSSHL